MAVFVVETYVIKPDKHGEFVAYLRKWETWVKKNPEVFKEAKSHRIFSHWLGGKSGTYVEMWEFDNLADCEKWINKFREADFITTLHPEFVSLTVPGLESTEIWNSVP